MDVVYPAALQAARVAKSVGTGFLLPPACRSLWIGMILDRESFVLQPKDFLVERDQS